MKMSKNRFWGQSILLSAVLFVIVVSSYLAINNPTIGKSNHGALLIISLISFFLAVFQVLYCSYYLIFVEYERRLIRSVYLLIIILFTLAAYWIAM